MPMPRIILTKIFTSFSQKRPRRRVYLRQANTVASSAVRPRKLASTAVALEVVLGSRTVEMLGTHSSSIHGPRVSSLAKVGCRQGGFEVMYLNE